MLALLLKTLTEAMADPQFRAAVASIYEQVVKPEIESEAKKIATQMIPSLVQEAISQIFHSHQKADAEFETKTAAIATAILSPKKEDKDAGQDALLSLMSSPGV